MNLSALNDLAADTTGAAICSLWKLASIVLLVALAGASAEWGLAAHDRDQARAELAAERKRADELGAAIREQNRAIDALAKKREEAAARGALAQKRAAESGRRLDSALARIADVRAETCAEAMPVVNQLLEAIR